MEWVNPGMKWGQLGGQTHCLYGLLLTHVAQLRAQMGQLGAQLGQPGAERDELQGSNGPYLKLIWPNSGLK